MDQLLNDMRVFLSEINSTQVLRLLLADYPFCYQQLKKFTIDHVGFLLPPDSKRLFFLMATKAGFNSNHLSFKSTIVEKELGKLARKDKIPVTVCKASHFDYQLGLLQTVEGFVPDVDIETAQPWLEKGICNHIAIKPEAHVDFPKLSQILTQSGFVQLSFSTPGGDYIVSENKTLAYFDFSFVGKPMRLEICLDGKYPVSKSNV